MITIEIQQQTKTIEDMVDTLREIANKIENGNVIGYDPTFVMSGEEEKI